MYECPLETCSFTILNFPKECKEKRLTHLSLPCLLAVKTPHFWAQKVLLHLQKWERRLNRERIS